MSTTDPQQAHEALLNHPDYRVLTRAQYPLLTETPEHANLRTAAFLNIETTGLDPNAHEIIQLSILPFTYTLETNEITSFEPIESQYQQPKAPDGIPNSATLHNGITNTDVQGQHFNLDKLTQIINNTDLLIAHHAAFVRPFTERLLPVTENKPWACLRADIPWLNEGVTRETLEHLSMINGLFFDEFDHEGKVLAAINILTKNLPRSEERILAALRRHAGMTTHRILITNHDISNRHDFQARRYRWSQGDSPTLPRGWWKDVHETNLEQELTWLRTTILQDTHDNTEIPTTPYNAFHRYSDRPLPQQ